MKTTIVTVGAVAATAAIGGVAADPGSAWYRSLRKVHLLADCGCRPLARVTSAGQRHDSLAFVPLIAGSKSPAAGRDGRGRGPAGSGPTRPIPARPSGLTCASAISRRPSPSPADQIRGRQGGGSKGGRPPAFDPGAYKQRNTVERAFSRLRQHRAVATRYDKRDFVYRGTVDVAAIRIWLRNLTKQDLRDTPYTPKSSTCSSWPPCWKPTSDRPLTLGAVPATVKGRLEPRSVFPAPR